jgi:two-component system KDP operon response regulator KdpE
MTPKILLVEDDPQIRRLLRVTLPPEGFTLLEAENGESGVAQNAEHNPDVIILDLGLPDIDGIEVVRRVREKSATPILVLSARGQDQDKVNALDAGADDYLTKPFSMPELLARIRVALRHAARTAGETAESVLTVGEIQIDQVRRVVTVGGHELALTANEYLILLVLVRQAGKVITHRQMMKEIWGPNNIMETHYLRVFMAQLRRKLEKDPARPRYLITEPGVGYRLKVD